MESTYTLREIEEIVDIILQSPDKVIDYLEHENSNYSVDYFVESAISKLKKLR